MAPFNVESVAQLPQHVGCCICTIAQQVASRLPKQVDHASISDPVSIGDEVLALLTWHYLQQFN